MFEIFLASMSKDSVKNTKPAIIILVLALLPGCAAVNPVKTEPPTAASTVCNADSDTFCVEGGKDSGARLNRQGLEFAAKQDYDQAMDQFKRAIELDNANPEYHYNLGVTYSFKGMKEEEEAAYMEVLAIESEDPSRNPALANTYFNLACLYALQGKKDQAFAQLDKLFLVDANKLYHYVQSDEDLNSLRDDPRYKQIMAKKPDNSKTEEAGKSEAQVK